jgi:hypothetical protein
MNRQNPSSQLGIPGGEVLESLRKMADIISQNDGVRRHSTVENTCYDIDAPFSLRDRSHIRITSNMFDVTQLGESFITCTIKTYITSDTAFTDPGKLGCLRIFSGVKNSNEVIRQMDLFHNENVTGYTSQNCVQEHHAYSTYKSKSSKEIHKFVHTQYDDIESYSKSIAGGYIDPAKAWPSANSTYEHTMDLNIPINDFYALQVFEDWPQLFGDLVMRLYFTEISQVFAQVDPNLVAFETYLQEDTTTLGSDDSGYPIVANPAIYPLLRDTPFKYDRKFNQVGVTGEFITGVEFTPGDQNTPASVSYETSKVTFDIRKADILSLRCTIKGYDINDNVKPQLTSLFTPENPAIIPAQQIEILQFNKPANDRTYNQALTFALRNVSDFIMAFPMDSRQTTCFENPMLAGVQLNIDNKTIPEMPLSTMGNHFYNLVTSSADLDDLFPATKEFEKSLTDSRLNHNFKPIIRNSTDRTNFLPIISVERKTSGYVFDGMETGNRNVSIRWKFHPIHQDAGDVYLSKTNHGPQLWLCRDTYFQFDTTNGLRYFTQGVPEKFATPVDRALRNVNGTTILAE